MFIEETLEDRQLMLSLKNGNSGSFDILHQRHRLRVFHLISRITNDAAAAEELSQEVFLRVYMARARYQPSASFSTWLYRIAFNRSLNWLRSQGPGKSTLSYDALPAAGLSALKDPATPEHLLLRRERIQRVRAAVAALSPRQREALRLHKFEDLDYAAIARHMGCTIPAVKSLLFRTCLMLQSRLSADSRHEKTINGDGK
ncbi:MAG: sigma-70 family RNA polymerase sigma factor [Bryobacterales bacterium]|nr:sigma-70 family RNA polymerase sigma factor [Bryobacterales bacterium]